jgi:hypothetical protein
MSRRDVTWLLSGQTRQPTTLEVLALAALLYAPWAYILIKALCR